MKASMPGKKYTTDLWFAMRDAAALSRQRSKMQLQIFCMLLHLPFCAC